jgi:predicted nucleic acid-binding protein
MKIIIDTSVFISALINPKGVIGNLLLNPIFHFEKYSCYYLVTEIFKHKEKILKYSKLSEEELIEQVYILIKDMTLVNENQIPKEVWISSFDLLKNIDENDVAFVALTIFIKGKLWSMDKKLTNGLRKKGFVEIIETVELQSNFFRK